MPFFVGGRSLPLRKAGGSSLSICLSGGIFSPIKGESKGCFQVKVYAIVVAAGQGKRMGGKVQKPYLELAKRPLLCYTLRN
ncbi:2-C-methyl-D-erythritol 4-phosphate cytidylyltransferase, partial [Candidatus Desantisbacteria bacterium]|nr:2-C-methyl-D-erythritol 4-phosphate cytidylyltransferase [Candidatus Desantisbacteria bacterium]